MSCASEDGRNVSGALGVGHSAVVMMMMSSHVVTRRILGAGGYCLTASVLLVHDRVASVVIVVIIVVAATATATADVGTTATIVVGRIQRRLTGMV